MKQNIHPEFKDATITCACGNVIETKSTRGNYSIDICSGCHPFFTGKQKLMDTEGRVERFRKKYGLKTQSIITPDSTEPTEPASSTESKESLEQ